MTAVTKLRKIKNKLNDRGYRRRLTPLFRISAFFNGMAVPGADSGAQEASIPL
jgi:hypothetical protein